MRGLGILTAKTEAAGANETSIEGVIVRSLIVELDPPDFDPAAQPDHVHLKVRAFSCNYRDKALILRAATNDTADGFYLIGSEFCAEVLAVGANVTDLAVGDRVIGNNAYPDSGVPGVVPGVPTNHASREFQVLHRAKLARIPDNMSDAVGASFSIGGQTTYSMVRRIAVADGDPVLVTAAKSNTSLFALAALKQRNVEVYALSTSDRYADRVLGLGVRELIVADPVRQPLYAYPSMIEVLKRIQGFAGVIDPYADLYLAHMPLMMRMGGRYTTCGFYNQYLEMVGKEAPRPPVPLGAMFGQIMMKNLSVIGNCIGTVDDLNRALADYAAGTLPVAMDQVFGGGESGPFIDRTYNASERFGKVVYMYD